MYPIYHTGACVSFQYEKGEFLVPTLITVTIEDMSYKRLVTHSIMDFLYCIMYVNLLLGLQFIL
jgi:hypothetical protein